MLTRRTDVMGDLVNSVATTALMFAVAAAIILLNLYLVYATIFGQSR